MKIIKTYKQLNEDNYYDTLIKSKFKSHLSYVELKLIIKHKKDNNIDVAKEINDSKDHILYSAVFFRKLNMVKLLLDNGADIKKPVDGNNNMTLLHGAAYNNDGKIPSPIKIIQLLTKHGADWFIKTTNGDYFIDLLEPEDKKELQFLYPEKYEQYLKLKKAKEFNL